MFAGLIILRKRNPHSEKMGRTQTQVNKKMNSGGKIAPDTVQAGTNGKNLLDRAKEKLVNWWFTGFLILAGAAAIFWSLSTPELRPADVGNLGQKYWLQILIVWSIGAGFIWLNTKEKTAKTLQKMLASVVFMTLIGFPMWSWITKTPDVVQHANSRHPGIPMTSDPKELWSRLVLPEGGKSERIAIDPGKTVAFHGKEFLIHCVYRKGHDESEIAFYPGETPCPKGDMPWAYVTNEAKGENIILYAFALI